MRSAQNQLDVTSQDSTVGRARIQGGNWNTPAFRRASELYDEVECTLTVEQFISEQGLSRDEDFR